MKFSFLVRAWKLEISIIQQSVVAVVQVQRSTCSIMAAELRLSAVRVYITEYTIIMRSYNTAVSHVTTNIITLLFFNSYSVFVCMIPSIYLVLYYYLVCTTVRSTAAAAVCVVYVCVVVPSVLGRHSPPGG